MRHATHLAAAGLAALLVLSLIGCGGGGGTAGEGDGGGSGSGGGDQTAPQAVAYMPAGGSTGVDPGAPW
jgi:hypothetical protein